MSQIDQFCRIHAALHTATTVAAREDNQPPVWSSFFAQCCLFIIFFFLLCCSGAAGWVGVSATLYLDGLETIMCPKEIETPVMSVAVCRVPATCQNKSFEQCRTVMVAANFVTLLIHFLTHVRQPNMYNGCDRYVGSVASLSHPVVTCECTKLCKELVMVLNYRTAITIALPPSSSSSLLFVLTENWHHCDQTYFMSSSRVDESSGFMFFSFTFLSLVFVFDFFRTFSQFYERPKRNRDNDRVRKFTQRAYIVSDTRKRLLHYTCSCDR